MKVQAYNYAVKRLNLLKDVILQSLCRRLMERWASLLPKWYPSTKVACSSRSFCTRAAKLEKHAYRNTLLKLEVLFVETSVVVALWSQVQINKLHVTQLNTILFFSKTHLEWEVKISRENKITLDRNYRLEELTLLTSKMNQTLCLLSLELVDTLL